MSLADFVFQNPDFKEMYDFSQVNEQIIEELSIIDKEFYSIKTFASRTCQYCKIYIPQLLKIYEYINFNLELVIWEDFTEDENIELMDQFSLLALPSILVYSSKPEKIEIGRITKQPKLSLERDLLDILKANLH